MKNQKSIFTVSSSGGHYSELMELVEHLPKDFKIIIFRDSIQKESLFSKVYFLKDKNFLNISISSVGRSLWRIINTFFIGSYLLIKDRPICLITTGAGIGTIFCLLCKFLFIPSIYICSTTHVKRIGLSCLFARFLANEFYVRHNLLAKTINCKYFPIDAIG